jgi:hypothetical protein
MTIWDANDLALIKSWHLRGEPYDLLSFLIWLLSGRFASHFARPS